MTGRASVVHGNEVIESGVNHYRMAAVAAEGRIQPCIVATIHGKRDGAQ
jgi:hypothetical protein